MASIRKRGETFTITAYMGYDESGKQRKKTTTFRPPDGVTPGKAEKLARAFAATWEEKIRGYVALDENRTFSELAEWYYSTVAPPMLDSLFAELQRSGNMEQHFRLKDKALCDGITRQELSDKAGIERSTLYTMLRGDTVSRSTAEKVAAALDMKLEKVFDDATEKKGLSGASTNKLKLNLSAIFTAAVKKEIMRRNPCKLATPPKIDTAPAAYLNETQCHELLDLLSAQDDFQFEVIINLFIASGIRAGELSALYWEDINLETGMMYIRYTLVRVDGVYIRQEPKTEDSTRRIVLPEYIIGLLKKHKTLQGERRLKMGGAWKDKELVFTNKSGGFYLGTNMNGKLKRIIKGTDLPQDLHLHSMRHTHASLLINSDIAARVIADRLGHSTTKTTLDICTMPFIVFKKVVIAHIFCQS